MAKSEDEATLVRRWYDPGTALNGCRPLCLFCMRVLQKFRMGSTIRGGFFPFWRVVLIRRFNIEGGSVGILSWYPYAVCH